MEAAVAANLDSAWGGAPHREGIGGAPPRLLCGAAPLSAAADGGPRAGSGPAFAHARAALEAEATAGSKAVVVTSDWDLQAVSKEYQDLKPKEKIGLLSGRVRAEWEILDAEARQKWEQQAAEAREVYERKMKAYEDKLAALAPPKRPPTADKFWLKANYATFAQKHPGKKMTEISGMLRQEWSELSDEGRARFKEQANKAKLEWYQAMEAHCRKEAELPQKGKSNYLLFMDDRRTQLSEENPGVKNSYLSKLLGQEWKALSEAAKKPYEEKARLEKARYDSEVEEYEALFGERPPQQRRSTPSTGWVKGGLRKSTARDPALPRRCISNYFWFIGERRAQLSKENPTLKNSYVSELLGREWKALSESAKKPYEENARLDKVRYEKEVEAYEALHGERPKQKRASKPRTKSANGALSRSKAPKDEGPRKSKVVPEADRPRGAKTSYFWFMDDRRAQLRMDNPDLTLGQLAKLMGQEWKALSEVAKQPYQEKAQLDKQRYNKEVGVLKANLP
eukprot:CAMPEP_0203891786 /NCGR_PEP_ID=MMETSP0359-20131031/35035_1 /ASSEMBLY_ACC=CAM_ASM_000338 /TAXON_ID=268821 /ORGANISM="Scrippsiella Hangoei, Strain SHTV-5" /LENGTH=509 /DNA_ID=CAMNT_0050813623 /DNA_START=97 /DNA_END=1628 /DNA_ORIENTATION=-